MTHVEPTGRGAVASSTERVLDERSQLYNSRLIANYVEYLTRHAPSVDVDGLLARAGMDRRTVEDPDAWLTQSAVDRFHEALEATVDDPQVSLKAGRFAVHARASGMLRQIVFALLDPGAVYARVDRTMSLVTRATDATGRRLGPDRAEVVFTPRPGVRERPFQCENRTGMLQGVAAIFTGSWPRIEHPECVHRSDPRCRYVVRWTPTAFQQWRKVRAVVALAAPLVAAAAAAFLPFAAWIVLVHGLVIAILAASFVVVVIDNRRLRLVADAEAAEARATLRALEERHAQSEVLRSLAEASSPWSGASDLATQAVDAMARWLDFEVVEVGILDAAGAALTSFSRRGPGLRGRDGGGCGSGPPPGEIARLPETHFQRRALERRETVLVSASEEETDSASCAARLRELGLATLACAPLVYGSEVLGTLVVASARAFEPGAREVQLLESVATQTALGLHNARAFERLEASERKYRDLVENADSAIVRASPEGAITFMNAFACSVFGLPEVPSAGARAVGTLWPETEGTRCAFEATVAALREAPGQLMVLETDERSPLRTSRAMAWTLKGITDDLGHLRELLAIGSDVTALRDAAKEREKLSAQLVQAQKMEAIGTLAGGIAHDFNNLMTGVLGNVALLLERVGPGDAGREMLEDIDTLARSAATLTRQLLGYARGGKYEVRPLDVNELLRSTLGLFGRATKQVRVETAFEEGLHPVLGDRGQLEQTMLNLFVNAGQAMPDGGLLRVETQNVRLGRRTGPLEPGPHVRITVEDTGVGMDAETQARVFEPFFTTRSRERGTGLGLASAYGIVRNHGGAIEVRSRPREGTTFEILLPASPEASVGREEERQTPISGAGTVLVVDDEPLVLASVRRILSRLGYDVLVASGGAEALGLLAEAQSPVDAVLLDMVMPGMNGIETFEAIRAVDPSLPVILSSGYTEDDVGERVSAYGAAGFLPKPFDVALLAAKVDGAMRARSGRRGRPSGPS